MTNVNYLNYDLLDALDARAFQATKPYPFLNPEGALTDEGYRRLLINACFWAVGMEKEIAADANVKFVGPFNGTWARGKGRRKSGTKPSDLAGWDTPIVPLQK